MLLALTRAIAPSIVHCELTHLSREPINLEIANEQHRNYEQTLETLGCRVERVAAAPELPDSVFIEDTAVVVDEVAVITRPGAQSRRGETAAVAAALRPYRSLVTIDDPGTLDGGDVLRIGRCFFVGLSGRSNADGVAQLRRALAPLGYSVEGVEVDGCLHLKSAITQVAESTLLLNPRWIEASLFADFARIEVDPSEPMGANALLIGETLLYPTAFPRTADRLRGRGLDVRTIEAGELAKAEGALTCCSVLLQV